MQPFNTALLNRILASATSLMLAVTLSGTSLAQDAQSAGSPANGGIASSAASSTEPSTQIASSELPDSPGASLAQSQDPSPQQSTPVQQPPSSAQTGSSSTTDQDQTQKPQRPVGTAAAEAPRGNGVTAAQPSGVAIAPAKQRRVRTIMLRVGAMVGAGAAVGTVIALTMATPSKPPGAK